MATIRRSKGHQKGTEERITTDLDAVLVQQQIKAAEDVSGNATVAQVLLRGRVAGCVDEPRDLEVLVQDAGRDDLVHHVGLVESLGPGVVRRQNALPLRPLQHLEGDVRGRESR